MFRGIIAPITTPFRSNGAVDYQALEENLARYSKTRLSGVLTLGTTGESAHLSFQERIEVAERVAGAVAPGLSFLVGVGFPALNRSLEFIEKIAHLKVAALLAAVPSYYKSRMNSEALGGYFEALADRSPFPVLLYNIPKFTGIELPPPLLGRLAAHPNIVGMKESSGDMIYLQRVQAATAAQQFELISGSAETVGLAATLGVRAGILAVSCFLPDFVVDVLESFESRAAELASKQGELFRISSTVVGRLSIPGIKYAMDLKGYRGLSCRLPLPALTPEERAEVEAVLR